jgi:hypothetical protein
MKITIKNIIKESVEDKKETFINKVVDMLVSNTEFIPIKNENGVTIQVEVIWPMYSNTEIMDENDIDYYINYLSNWNLSEVEIEYIYDMFGIEDQRLTQTIFDKYGQKSHTIINNMLNGDIINESVVDKKERYYNHIVDYLIKNTQYKIETYSDMVPRVNIVYPDWNVSIEYSLYDIEDDFINYVHDPYYDPPYHFRKGSKINTIYNLTDSEIDLVVTKYINKLGSILHKEMERVNTRY